MKRPEFKKFYVEFGGDPSKDKENYKRYCGKEKFEPVSYAEEVIEYIEAKSVLEYIAYLEGKLGITPADIDPTALGDANETE